MTKKKKLVKEALKRGELHSPAELAFFQRWLQARKARKEAEKAEKKAQE
jgi:hypothetical protein